jgi:membrane-associated phospholipid phosphatase
MAYQYDRHGHGLDNTVDGWVHQQFGYRNGFLTAVLHLADLPVVVGGLAVVVVAALVRGRREVAWLAVLGPTTALVFTELVLKPLVHRVYGTSLSYPSGHTTSIVSVAAVLGVLLLSVRPLVAAMVAVVLAFVVVLVATALVGLDYHYATDTVGGFCTAFCVMTVVALLLDLAAARRDARPGTEATTGVQN